MSVGLNLLQNNSDIEKGLLLELANQINKRAYSIRSRVQLYSQALVEDRLSNCPEVIALLDENSDLHKQFGAPSENVKQVMILFSKSVVCSVNPLTVVSRGISTKPLFTIKSIFVSELESSPLASVLTNKGKELHWLNWLLVCGDSIVIEGFHYGLPNSYERKHFSREGGLMYKGNQWFVPPQYSGDDTNNFITRSLQGIEDDIGKTIEGLMN